MSYRHRFQLAIMLLVLAEFGNFAGDSWVLWVPCALASGVILPSWREFKERKTL